jgi:hypothetical protein
MALRLTYSFTDTIYCEEKRHFRVLRRAGMEKPIFLSYDGLIDSGRINPVKWPGPDKDTWRDFPSAMFFVLTSIDQHHDEDDASENEAVTETAGKIKAVVTKGKGKEPVPLKKDASRNRVSRVKDGSRNEGIALSSANSSGTKTQPQKRRREALGDGLVNGRAKRPRTGSTQKTNT